MTSKRRRPESARVKLDDSTWGALGVARLHACAAASAAVARIPTAASSSETARQRRLVPLPPAPAHGRGRVAPGGVDLAGQPGQRFDGTGGRRAGLLRARPRSATADCPPRLAARAASGRRPSRRRSRGPSPSEARATPSSGANSADSVPAGPRSAGMLSRTRLRLLLGQRGGQQHQRQPAPRVAGALRRWRPQARAARRMHRIRRGRSGMREQHLTDRPVRPLQSAKSVYCWAIRAPPRAGSPSSERWSGPARRPSAAARDVRRPARAAPSGSTSSNRPCRAAAQGSRAGRRGHRLVVCSPATPAPRGPTSTAYAEIARVHGEGGAQPVESHTCGRIGDPTADGPQDAVARSGSLSIQT